MHTNGYHAKGVLVEPISWHTSLTEKLALRGSQRWLHLMENGCPDVITGAIAKVYGIEHGETVQRLSPLNSDTSTQFRGHAFLERLSCLTIPGD